MKGKKAQKRIKIEDLPEDRELSDEDLNKVSGGASNLMDGSSSLKSPSKAVRRFIGGEGGGGIGGEGGGGIDGEGGGGMF